MDLHQHHLALDRRVVRDVADFQNFNQAVKLLGDLLNLFGLDHQRQAADARRFAVAHGQALDIEATPAEQADRAIQHARPILHQRDDRVFVDVQGLLLIALQIVDWRLQPICNLKSAICIYTCDASVIVSPMLLPCGTIGHTFTSRSTRKSISTGPSVA